MGGFPTARPRRLRRTPALRRVVAETRLHPAELVLPVFVREGIDAPVPISAMPGVVQHTLDSLGAEGRRCVEAGLGGIMVFGVPVALATDVNPGGGLSPSMPFVIALACFAMEMTFEEALVGATINAAWSLDRSDVAGSLESGKLADLVVVDGDPINIVRVGAPSSAAVFKKGALGSGGVAGARAGP